MINRVFALPYRNMSALVATDPTVLENEYLIGIVGSGGKPIFESNGETRLLLRFDDVLPEDLGNGAAWIIFSESQADKIIDFLLHCKERRQTRILYVHCAAGVSRSGAVARFANSLFELSEQRFRYDNPAIVPNQHVLRTLENRWACANRSAREPDAQGIHNM